MKTFKLACAAFLLSIAVSAVLSVYTCGVIGEMKNFADGLPDAIREGVSVDSVIGAEEYWDKNKLRLSLSVSHAELDDIEEALSAVSSAIENKGNSSDAAAAYAGAISSLRERLARLLESERLSLEGIL